MFNESVAYLLDGQNLIEDRKKRRSFCSYEWRREEEEEEGIRLFGSGLLEIESKNRYRVIVYITGKEREGKKMYLYGQIYVDAFFVFLSFLTTR